jgi:hypothetical protein
MAAPQLPAPIKKAPKAFVGWAQRYNQSLLFLEALSRMKGGTGIEVLWSTRDVLITNTRPAP